MRVIIRIATLWLALAAAPAVAAAAPPATAGAVRIVEAATAGEAAGYRERERQAVGLEDFEGGRRRGAAIPVTTVIIVLLVVILVLIII